MDARQAIASHLSWKSLVKALVKSGNSSQLDAAQLGRSDACELGLWIESEETSVQYDEELVTHLRNLHKQFHELAGRIVERYQAGDKDTLQHEFDEFESVSDLVIDLLYDLEDSVK